MRILVTGVKGQLGHDVVNEMVKRGLEPVGVDLEEMDITDAGACRKVITESKVDAVIHCAAYTAVDAAEDNVDVCRKVNADGTRNIAEVCRDLDIKMMYISTDYVFDGDKNGAYFPEDRVCPVSVYGESKELGEQFVRAATARHFIVRISWVFGVHGNNFVKTMLRLAETRDTLNVVCDQVGSPTYTADLAVLLCNMFGTEEYGTYHATNADICSWYEFACEIFRQAGKNVKVVPVTTQEYLRMVPQQARRPKNSVLAQDKLSKNGFALLPEWKDALKRFLAEI